ncbi:hypothetical protein NDA13_003120 [Ustilago tritici]|nr:hypothetical protein NDA13_003120 [Ustilago tritici]
MQTWHLRQITWNNSLDLMREIELPLFNYHGPGHTVYIAAGRVSMMMSADAGGVYTIKVANPSVKEWNDILPTSSCPSRPFVAAAPPRLPEEAMTTGVVKEEVGAKASGSSRARDKRRISLVYDSQDEQDETERQEP